MASFNALIEDYQWPTRLKDLRFQVNARCAVPHVHERLMELFRVMDCWDESVASGVRYYISQLTCTPCAREDDLDAYEEPEDADADEDDDDPAERDAWKAPGREAAWQLTVLLWQEFGDVIGAYGQLWHGMGSIVQTEGGDDDLLKAIRGHCVDAWMG